MQSVNHSPSRAAYGRQTGFSLIELLVVITIMGILAAVVVVNVAGVTDDAKVAAVKTDFKAIHAAIERFKMKHGVYPESLEELVSGPEDPHTGDPTSFIEDLPLDPWSHEPYEWDKDDRGRPFLKSYGEDQAEGGEGYAKDIISNEKRETR